jgi:hypothetical protein
VRLGRWKGVRFETLSPVFLYDLETDPGETRDVLSAYPGVIVEIARIMEREHVPPSVGKFRARTGREAFYWFERWPAYIRWKIMKGYDILMDLMSGS